jgi:hypothetical protein
MRDFWERRRDRADWPKPRTEFLNSLADEVRETRKQARFSRFRLALVLGVLVALLLPLAAFADRSPAGDTTRDTITAVVSYLQANTVGTASVNSRSDDDDDDGGGGGGGDDDDDGGGGGGGGGGDDDDDGGGGGDDDDDDDYRGGGGDDDDDGGGGGDDDD